MKGYNQRPPLLIKQWEAALKKRGLKDKALKVAESIKTLNPKAAKAFIKLIKDL